ncbi:MAG TPA: DNA polymerase III subunit gamma/tau [Anaeromyxobacteraceae bacterium]|nr:DNA polymerase III subunit gamma/tau [Anaeromyxobacteraceae bacterium]
MAYLALARKYRPQTFAAMAGQEHVVRTLSNSLQSGQLAHAFLFTGPRGVGKTTSARLVAKALNCEKGPTAEPCGACAPCVEIADGRAVDVVEIDAASNNGVDNVRDIVEAVKYRPARDRFKVFVVDEVHMLSQGAFNALLKTLEEPPPHVKFVLATTDVRKVPETIVSRCQRFDFHRLTVAQIAEQLRRVAQAEGMVFSDASLALVARGAEGGMRDALSLLDRVRAACGDRPGDAEVAEAVGVVDSASVARIAWGLVRRDGAAVLAEIAALHERGLEMRRVAEEVVRHLRNAAVARLVPGAPLDLADAERQEVLAQAQAAPPEQLVRLFDVAQRAVFEVRMAEQPRYALEVALLKGVFLAPGAEVSELIARLEEIAGGPPPGGPTGRSVATAGITPTPRTEAATPTATSTPATSAEPITPSAASPQGERSRGAPTPGERAVAAFGTPGCAVPGAAAAPPPAAGAWRALVEQAEQASPVVGQVLRQAVLLRLSEGEVVIQVAPGLAAQTAERRRGEIEAVLERHFGRPTRLAVTASAAPSPEAAGGASLAQVDREEREARSARVREAARSHANIREAAQILGADVAKVDEL